MNPEGVLQGKLKYVLEMPFETQFKYESNRLWIERNTSLLLSITGVYLMAIVIGTKIMASRAPFSLKWPLILWNISLSLFSLLGFIRILQEFIWTCKVSGLYGAICHANKSDGPYALWSFLFTMSKVIELIDTLFIVLKRSNLIFLHWYHHSVTLIFGILAASSDLSLGRWIMAMNFFVHFFMYGYYALKQMGFYIPKMVAMLITTIQLTQMAVGLIVFSYAQWINWLPFEGKTATATDTVTTYSQAKLRCETSQTTLTTGLLMYFSYLILFVQFFIKAYFTKSYKSKNTKGLKLDLNKNLPPLIQKKVY